MRIKSLAATPAFGSVNPEMARQHYNLFAYSLIETERIPIVILATVDSAGPGETRMDEWSVADAADEAILVPRSVGYAHYVAIGDAQSASLAHLMYMLFIIILVLFDWASGEKTDLDATQFEFDGQRDVGNGLAGG